MPVSLQRLIAEREAAVIDEAAIRAGIQVGAVCMRQGRVPALCVHTAL